jgi:hypothetical protein
MIPPRIPFVRITETVVREILEKQKGRWRTKQRIRGASIRNNKSKAVLKTFYVY